MRIFDTHAHYDSRGFKEDREEILRYIHEEQDISVGRIVNNGADMASSYTSLKLAEEHDFIYAAVGVHPDSAGEL
ncbi:MAG: TatD family hydrolase, partial [Lachnospiraceae bacterium]|nr:TatD family hydrolase [Lachnospiraceae bacterium]